MQMGVRPQVPLPMNHMMQRGPMIHGLPMAPMNFVIGPPIMAHPQSVLQQSNNAGINKL